MFAFAFFLKNLFLYCNNKMSNHFHKKTNRPLFYLHRTYSIFESIKTT